MEDISKIDFDNIGCPICKRRKVIYVYYQGSIPLSEYMASEDKNKISCKAQITKYICWGCGSIFDKDGNYLKNLKENGESNE